MRLALHLLASLLLAAAAPALASGKPPVPPGLDPGGLAVALIGPGLDYTRPEVAVRLARDGEGDLVGRDLVDGDARPFANGPVPAHVPDHNLIAQRVSAAAASPSPAASAGRLRLVPVRVALDDLPTLARAVAFAASTPARVVVLPVTAMNGPQGELVRQAALRFPRVLFLVGLTEEEGSVSARPSGRVIRSDNLVFVSVAVDAKPEPPLAELMVEVDEAALAPSTPARRRDAAIAGALIAVGCIADREPALGARDLKARLLAAADPTRATAGRRSLAVTCP